MANNYCESFTIDQKTEILEFFNNNGFVVINSVFSSDECKQLFNHVGSIMTKLEPTFNINDYSTYDSISPFMNNFGMVSKGPNFDTVFLNMRQNKNVHDIGKIFIDDFVVSHDRFIFYRPTKNVFINGGILDKPEWSTFYKYPGLHLDMDPRLYQDNKKSISIIKSIRENITYDDGSGFVSEGHIYNKSEGLQLQGMLNAINNYEDDGGFMCVPSFTLQFDEWYEQKVMSGEDQIFYKDIGKYSFNELSKTDMKYIYNMKRITAKAGSLILWDRRMAHTGKINISGRPRLGLPIAFSSKDILTENMRCERRNFLKKIISKNNFEVTDIGKNVFDLL